MAAFAINYFQQGCKSSMVSHWAGRSWGRAHSWFQALSSPPSASQPSFFGDPLFLSPQLSNLGLSGKNSPTQFSPGKISSSSTLLICYTRSTLVLVYTSLKNTKQETRDGRKNGLHCQLPPQRFMPLRLILLCLVKVPLEGKRRSKNTL